jgi:hypothetical protein
MTIRPLSARRTQPNLCQMRWTRPPDSGEAAPGDRAIPFVAYTSDSVIAGMITLESARLSDLLSAAAAYQVRHATVEPLGDGPPLELDEVLVVRDDVCLVAGTGPRGDPGRRVPTQAHPVHARTGPYEVWGYLHAAHASDPLAMANGRQIIPLTDGWIRYPRFGRFVERAHPTILVNRHHLASLELVPVDDVGAYRSGVEVTDAFRTRR